MLPLGFNYHADYFSSYSSYSSSSSDSERGFFLMGSPFYPFLRDQRYLLRQSFRIQTQFQNPKMFTEKIISSPLIVLRFQVLHFQHASLVMNEMNYETHYCTAYLASLAILAVSGRAFFMMRLILAIGRQREQLLSKKIERKKQKRKGIPLVVHIVVHCPIRIQINYNKEGETDLN